MDKNVAKLLLPLINDIYLMEMLSVYANSRIEHFHKQMESQEDVKASQGAIRELRRLDTLRDEVLGALKNGNN